MNLSRRGFLAGLLSSAAAISTGPVAKILPVPVLPLPVGRYEAYTSYFRLEKEVVSCDWKSVTRIVSGFVPARRAVPDLFKMLEGAPA